MCAILPIQFIVLKHPNYAKYLVPFLHQAIPIISALYGSFPLCRWGQEDCRCGYRYHCLSHRNQTVTAGFDLRTISITDQTKQNNREVL
jgi:hypothetical protein